ncbi:MAG TPA: cell division protein ZapA [Caulobacteraceae bacterium]|jgi:cell division protein ZapA (FtsZ GTPase activity inhibitor)|nr:cell division protein ZapA [Caulobacteraceae bacterium]
MSVVKLAIAGKRYDIDCEKGAEDKLRSLGELVDSKARQVVVKGGSAEVRRILLAALMLADELSHATARATAAEEAAAQLGTDLVNLEAQAGEILAATARRIDDIGADWE